MKTRTRTRTRTRTAKPATDSLAGAGRALRRAARVARQTARRYGTPVYVWRDGKVVAEKP